MSRRWGVPFLLLLAALLALVQQQVLLQRPPRLMELRASPGGGSTLRARFSRPMQRASLQADTRLDPPRPHRWLGEGDTLLLSLASDAPPRGALQLTLNGRDRRGLALARSRWRWDPRGRVLALANRGAGEQLQLRDHDGRWLPLGPVWHRLRAVEALGNGAGVAFSSEDALGNTAVWQIPLQPNSLSAGLRTPPPPQPGRIEALEPGPLVFAHLSSDQRGSLLIQSAGDSDPRVSLLEAGGSRRSLDLKTGGALRLLPEGGGVVVPSSEGLAVHDLPPRPPRQQLLPGSRDLLAFCPRAGRALLLRHWPDFRRSIERIEPGQPPRQIWLGEAAVLGGACAGGGERVWLLLLDGLGQPQASLVALDGQGRRLALRRLPLWEVEPGAGLHYDPGSQQLLTTLRPQRTAGSARAAAPAHPVLFEASSLVPTPLALPARRAVWLPPG